MKTSKIIRFVWWHDETIEKLKTLLVVLATMSNASWAQSEVKIAGHIFDKETS